MKPELRLNLPFDSHRPPQSLAYVPGWVDALFRVPLVGKIAGANAIIVAGAVLMAMLSGAVGQDWKLWLLLLIALGLGLAVNATLVSIALRPLKSLERTARDVWQGELDARVPGSTVADAGMQRVGSTLNMLLDGLSADRARLRDLAKQVIQAGDCERARIARELHDSTAQSLAALLLELSVLAGENADPQLDSRIARVRSIVSDVLDEVRLLAHTMHPRVLDDLGLVAALQLLARESALRGSGNVMYAGPARIETIDAACASALYRVAQEAVGNAIRHARATSVSIRMQEASGHVELEIADNGIGFSVDEAERRRPGMGLFTMRERAALVGGRLTVQSAQGRGTTVVAVVPVTPQPPAPSVRLADLRTDNSGRQREES